MSHAYYCVRPAKPLRWLQWLEGAGGVDGNRTTLLFFAGSLRKSKAEYSGGARQVRRIVV